MNKKYKHFPVIGFSGGLFYFSLIFFKTPIVMLSIMFLAFSIVYIPTGSIRLALYSPVVFLLGAITGTKPFIDKERGVLVLTHKDYVLEQKGKQIFGILILE